MVWSAALDAADYGHDGGNAGANDNKGGDGPRSTPSIDGGSVYVLSADFVLGSFSRKTAGSNGRMIYWVILVVSRSNGKTPPHR